MRAICRHWLALALAALLAGCGGGDSSTTRVSGLGLNSLGLSPAVATAAFVPLDNNLVVQVEQGPGFGINTNLLYATVTLCYPGSTTRCAVIDHVLVDTGSVGLRVLASKVQALGLPPVQLSVDPAPVQNAWECFPFVIGGLWGPNVAADVVLGPQATVGPALSVQLIDDLGALAPSAGCNSITHSTPQKSNILSTASSLGANGILGIGSTNLDCGRDCNDGKYSISSVDGTGSSVLYYQCPQGASDPATCSLSAMPIALQVFNPVSALAPDFNAGVVLAMPAIPDSQPGAATATGELILGLGTRPNNSSTATHVMLGVGASPNPDSYLSITTQYGNAVYHNSYLDTGTNAMFFYDPSLPVCASSTWYCPASNMNVQAILSDGDDASLHRVSVPFRIGNFEALNATSNTAFNSAAGYVSSGSQNVPDSASFAWGMPFFYGKKVYLSIWDISAATPSNGLPANPPWYAWEPL